MASVRKRDPKDPQSPWIVEYTDASGKRRRKTPKTGLKKDADALRQRIERELSEGVHTAGVTVLFKQAVEAWIDDCERCRRPRGEITLATLAFYQSMAPTMIEKLGKIRVGQLTTPYIQQAFIDPMVTSKSPKTVANYAVGLRLALAFCVQREWLVRSPLRDKRLRLPRVQRTAKCPTRDELLRIIEAARNPDPSPVDWRKRPRPDSAPMRQLLVALAIAGGLRSGEMRGLHWEDIDFEHGIVRVRRSLSPHDGLKSPKTEAGIRAVPLTTPIIEALEAIRRLRPGKGRPTGYVLTTEAGRPFRAANLHTKHWHKILRDAGLLQPNGKHNYRLHDLRHAAVSLMAAKGLSAMHIKNFIGHARIQTTIDIYGHMFPDDMAVRNTSIAIAEDMFTPKMRHDDTNLLIPQVNE